MGTTKKTINTVFFILLFTSILLPQTVTKVLISGLGGQHDADVQTCFELGYSSYNGTQFTGTITRRAEGVYNSLEFANANGYQMIVRSTTGVGTAINYAPGYPGVQLVMPAGSNSYVYVFSGDITTCPVIVTGAGDDYNETGYKVEFYAPDPLSIEPDYSSFSNGFIAGQIAYLANSLNKTVQQARIIARETIGGDSGPDMYDGYGQIDVQTVMTNLLPVELQSFTASTVGNKVTLNWTTSTEKNNYGFEIERLKDSKIEQSTKWEKAGFVKGSGSSSTLKEYSFNDDGITAGNYSYRLKQIDNDGTFEYSDIVKVNLNPAEFALQQNYPNPFNPSTKVSFIIGNMSLVTLKIYDVLGNEIETLVNEAKEPGQYDVAFNAGNLASGIYYYTLQAGNYTESKKMILIK